MLENPVFLKFVMGIHIFAAVFWLGGLFFLSFIVPDESWGPLMKRFGEVASHAVAFTFLSGILLLFVRYPRLGLLETAHGVALTVKMVAATLAGLNFFTIRLLLLPKLEGLAPVGNEVSSQAYRDGLAAVRNVSRLNLFLGLVVVAALGVMVG